MASKGPQPDFVVSDEHKMQLTAMMIPQLFDALQEAGGAITADDFIDVLALGIAAMLENDTHLTTPKLDRIALDTARTHVERRLRFLRNAREAGGPSALQQILEGQFDVPDDPTY